MITFGEAQLSKLLNLVWWIKRHNTKNYFSIQSVSSTFTIQINTCKYRPLCLKVKFIKIYPVSDQYLGGIWINSNQYYDLTEILFNSKFHVFCNNQRHCIDSDDLVYILIVYCICCHNSRLISIVLIWEGAKQLLLWSKPLLRTESLMIFPGWELILIIIGSRT